MFNKIVSPDGDHVVLTQFILSVTWCRLDDKSRMASFPLLSLKHHVSNPSPVSSAMQCLLSRPLPCRAFSCSGVTGHTLPLSPTSPCIPATNDCPGTFPPREASSVPTVAEPFPSELLSSEPRSLPSSLRPAVLPWVGVIRSTPLLCGDLSASAEQSLGARIFYSLPSAKPRTFQKAGAQKHVLYWVELNQSLQEHFDKSN